jgi:hypothetical protein
MLTLTETGGGCTALEARTPRWTLLVTATATQCAPRDCDRWVDVGLYRPTDESGEPVRLASHVPRDAMDAVVSAMLAQDACPSCGGVAEPSLHEGRPDGDMVCTDIDFDCGPWTPCPRTACDGKPMEPMPDGGFCCPTCGDIV